MIKEKVLIFDDLDKLWEVQVFFQCIQFCLYFRNSFFIMLDKFIVCNFLQFGKYDVIVKNVYDLLVKLVWDFLLEQLDYLFECFQVGYVFLIKNYRFFFIVLYLRNRKYRGDQESKL